MMTTMMVLTAMVEWDLKEGFNPARLARIPVRMRELTREGAMRGSVVLVQRKGKVVLLDAQGEAREGVPVKTDTVFQVMSMTKAVVATAAMILVEDGRLRLDAPVSDFIPAFGSATVGGEAVKRPVLVRHLMTHTSGLSGNDPGGLSDEEKVRLTVEEYAAKFGPVELQSQPGERIAYSGPGIAALGRIIEISSGMKLEHFLETLVFRPLGMKDTWFFLPEAQRGRLAFLYERSGSDWKVLAGDPYREGARYANPAGGLYSTAADMGRFIDCLASGGAPLLSPSGLRTMTMVQTGDLTMEGSDALGYGLGFTVVKSAGGTNQLKPIGSFGHTGAFGTEFWGDRATGVSAVYLSQSWESGPRKVFNALVNGAFVGP